MRYYEITAGPLSYTSVGASGYQNPGALNVELDATLQSSDQPVQGVSCRVWGIGLADIAQAQNLYDQPFTLKGGMSPGLPLANPAQAGTLVSGKIFRAFGNWIGTEQTLDFVVSPSGVSPASTPGPNPVQQTKPIVFNAPKGTPFGDAITKALQDAYPDFKVDVNIGDVKAETDQVGYHSGLEQFAHYIRRYSQSLTNGVGISIHPFDGTFNVFDDTMQSAAGTIAYTDLIGQPTWIDVGKMQIKVVMRADIKVGQKITLPQTLVTNTANGGVNVDGAQSPRQSLTFQGDFTVSSIHHLGNFRQPDANSWVTIIEAYTASGGSGSSSSGGSSSGTF